MSERDRKISAADARLGYIAIGAIQEMTGGVATDFTRQCVERLLNRVVEKLAGHEKVDFPLRTGARRLLNRRHH